MNYYPKMMEVNMPSDLYNISTKDLQTINTHQMVGNIFNDISSGFVNYFQAKSNYYQQASEAAIKSTQLVNQSIPLYQQIGAQVRQQMNQQAMQYMNAGVDISQGTAFKVISHTQQQGEMKLNEIKNNVNTNLNNMKSIATAQATMSLMSNIFSGINSGINRGFDFMNSAAKAGAFSQNPQKNNNNNIINPNLAFHPNFILIFS